MIHYIIKQTIRIILFQNNCVNFVLENTNDVRQPRIKQSCNFFCSNKNDRRTYRQYCLYRSMYCWLFKLYTNTFSLLYYLIVQMFHLCTRSTPLSMYIVLFRCSKERPSRSTILRLKKQWMILLSSYLPPSNRI